MRVMIAMVMPRMIVVIVMPVVVVAFMVMIVMFVVIMLIMPVVIVLGMLFMVVIVVVMCVMLFVAVIVMPMVVESTALNVCRQESSGTLLCIFLKNCQLQSAKTTSVMPRCSTLYDCKQVDEP